MFKLIKGREIARNAYKDPAWIFAEVGDSFFIPAINVLTARNYAWKKGKRLGRKFATRSEPDGVWIYRIECGN